QVTGVDDRLGGVREAKGAQPLPLDDQVVRPAGDVQVPTLCVVFLTVVVDDAQRIGLTIGAGLQLDDVGGDAGVGVGLENSVAQAAAAERAVLENRWHIGGRNDAVIQYFKHEARPVTAGFSPLEK